MITLTKKAADRFKQPWKDLEEMSGDNWKIDIIMVSRIPVMLIIHEYTLYTLVRRKTHFKTISSVINEISAHCPWYKIPENPVTGKNNDRRLNGSITEIKRISAGDYSDNFTEEIAKRINTCIYSYLSERKFGYGSPEKALEKYKLGLWPPNSGTLKGG